MRGRLGREGVVGWAGKSWDFKKARHNFEGLSKEARRKDVK